MFYDVRRKTSGIQWDVPLDAMKEYGFPFDVFGITVKNDL
jgi:hypothetical protein